LQFVTEATSICRHTSGKEVGDDGDDHDELLLLDY